jgi:peptide/nickel transport system substrate-binding protein
MRKCLHREILQIIPAFILFVLIMSACAEATEVVIPISITRQPSPSPTTKIIMPTEMPPPPKVLAVCLKAEPSSLFLYDHTQPEADTVLQAIYDGPLDVLNYTYKPVILTKLPSLEDGDARIEQVAMSEGEIYLNPETQLPDTLESQKPYLPSGCHQRDCMQTFTEGEVILDRIVVEFELLSDITWSDGEPLKASDSVYSFQVDAHEAIPTTKYLIQRTSRYVALDEMRTQWVGIPGFLDMEFVSNFWSPLPEHILGSYDFDELLETEEATTFPIGWGPYVIDRWEQGEEILLRRSETYFRSAEGLPTFDILRFRFLGSDDLSALEQVLTGECDILDETILTRSLWDETLDLERQDRMQIASTPGTVIERIDFNITKNSSFESISLFADVRTRQAIAGCIDRQAIMEEATFGLSVILDSYLPPTHPLHSSDLDPPTLTRMEAIDLLEEIGWQDTDQDPTTPRQAFGIQGVVNSATLELNLLTTDDATHQLIAENVEDDLLECGIGVTIEYGDPDELFTPWPNGPVFGGRFDMVAWAWPIFVSPPCELYAGFEIPSADFPFGLNAMGFSDDAYDQACERIMYGPSTGEDYHDAIRQTEEIYQSKVPSIPLFLRPRLIAFGEGICGVVSDPTSFSALWNIEAISGGDDCTP